MNAKTSTTKMSSRVTEMYTKFMKFREMLDELQWKQVIAMNTLSALMIKRQRRLLVQLHTRFMYNCDTNIAEK